MKSELNAGIAMLAEIILGSTTEFARELAVTLSTTSRTAEKLVSALTPKGDSSALTPKGDSRLGGPLKPSGQAEPATLPGEAKAPGGTACPTSIFIANCG